MRFLAQILVFCFILPFGILGFAWDCIRRGFVTGVVSSTQFWDWL